MTVTAEINNLDNDAHNVKKNWLVYIIDGARTPFIKARGGPGPFTPVELADQIGLDICLQVADMLTDALDKPMFPIPQ